MEAAIALVVLDDGGVRRGMPSRRRSFAKRFIHSIDVDDSPRARKSREPEKVAGWLVSSPAPTKRALARILIT
jgi:hypothetical protein